MFKGNMDNELMTPFDAMTQTRELQMLKTVVPYINNDQKRRFALLIKFMELKNTAQFFAGGSDAIAMCSVDENDDFPLTLLLELKKFCNEKEQEMIDTATSIISLKEMSYEL
jgi:hypothetical protein